MSGLSYQTIRYLKELKVPQRFDPDKECRQTLRMESGMWTVVDLTWTKALADYIGSRRCLEVFAGRGWLSKALAHHGVDVMATSRFSAHDGSRDGLVYDVIDMSAREAITNFDFEVLILGWPTADKAAFEAVQWARKLGKTFEIVFVGEPLSTQPAFLSGTASDEFFECCEVVKEIREYREARGKSGIDVCQIMRVKHH